jgi:hypothetical protein
MAEEEDTLFVSVHFVPVFAQLCRNVIKIEFLLFLFVWVYYWNEYKKEESRNR